MEKMINSFHPFGAKPVLDADRGWVLFFYSQGASPPAICWQPFGLEQSLVGWASPTILTFTRSVGDMFGIYTVWSCRPVIYWQAKHVLLGYRVAFQKRNKLFYVTFSVNHDKSLPWIFCYVNRVFKETAILRTNQIRVHLWFCIKSCVGWVE